MSSRRPLRILLCITAAVAGAALAARAWFGPYQFLMSVRSPINAESIFAAACILLIITAPPVTAEAAAPNRREDAYSLALLTAFLAAAMWPFALVGFLADDYPLILTAASADLSGAAHWFTTPVFDNLFYRPISLVSYWIDSSWAGFSPVRWHMAAWAFHAFNAALLFVLSRRLGLPSSWSLFAAGLFGIHASRPEAVAWVAARFDLVATLFVLVSLILFLAYLEKPRPVLLALLLSTTLCGLLSKESAFTLPALFIAIAWYRKDAGPAARRAILTTSLLTMAAFLHRWYILGGIGGYVDQAGHPLVSTFNPPLILKALALRLWAVLLFPLNWTDPLGRPLQILLTITIVAVLMFAFRAKLDRLALLGLALTLIAALPVVHLLLIGPDLEKSRVIYLASAGFALFLAALARQASPPLAFAAVLAILAFQLTGLRHNLAIWQRVSEIHLRACDTLSLGRHRDSQAVAVAMPNTWGGIYMLRTGLPECLEVRHGMPAKNLHMVLELNDPGPYSSLAIYTWNDVTARIVRVR